MEQNLHADRAGSGGRDNGFAAFFDREIAPALAEVERQRSRRMLLVYELGGLGLFAGAGVFVATATDMHAILGISRNLLQISCFAVMFGSLLAAFFAYRALYRRFKGVLAGKVAAYRGLEYRTGGFEFPLERFEPLLPYHRSHRLEDRLAGAHKGVDIELCEGRFKRPGAKDKKDKTVFNGLLLSYSFPKPFSAQTVVLPDHGAVGNLLERMRQEGDPVQLEGLAFEDRFEVYSTGKLEAFRLLTPAFMEKIEALAAHFGTKRGLALAFLENRLLITVRRNRTNDQFESGHLFRPVADWPERARKVDAQIAAMLDVVDVLNIAAADKKQEGASR
ncbi:DUF3137 domain-containing protein [Mesorhizobium sp. Z1-4]|uniref:DUF3137 domain-containing protein n=1 Tax=Mesorhizobium sp. Z1-4 TaxID=2448478 RepID=UPI000FD7AB01|nr:DUF3137 domain-containing protein [Mesorhizobium sp. Z1-4]